MTKRHSEEEIRAVCHEIAERDGVEALSRPAVQAALQERAVAAGREPKAAANATVTRIVAQVKAELGAARMAARAAASAREGVSLPDALAGALARCVQELEAACRQELGAERQRSAAEARLRVEAVEREAAAQCAVLEADLLSGNGEIASLARELDEARDRGDGLETRLEDAITRLAEAEKREAHLREQLEERSGALTILHVEATKRSAALEDELRAAREAHHTERERAHAATLQAAEAVTALARTDERHAVLAAECGRWQEAAARQEARAADAERARDEARGRLGAVEAEGERLRAEIAVYRDSGVAVPQRTTATVRNGSDNGHRR